MRISDLLDRRVVDAAGRRQQRYIRWADIDRAEQTIVLAATIDELPDQPAPSSSDNG